MKRNSEDLYHTHGKYIAIACFVDDVFYTRGSNIEYLDKFLQDLRQNLNNRFVQTDSAACRYKMEDMCRYTLLYISSVNRGRPHQNTIEFSKQLTIPMYQRHRRMRRKRKTDCIHQIRFKHWQYINISSIFEDINKNNKHHYPNKFNEINSSCWGTISKHTHPENSSRGV